MKANDIRKAYLEYFKEQTHEIVPSAPMVVKNDPTLMFTNAGMNQFKDIFLGNAPVKFPRIADSQKCLRVSGKHNDLEEVGHDTYHHTMFEMLGNWSFGDYFKKDSIAWAWDFLINRLKIDKNNVYVTVFEGDTKDKLEFDQEAFDFWKEHIDESRILRGNKKDNFWEMGDSGPCGPCSEIHVDIRNADEKAIIPGRDLVNASHPQVIEIWNLVFIQFNRKANGELESLPAKHVDTGMGFERLCMVVQGKQSNYDTDVFQPIIGEIGRLCGKTYTQDVKVDIAMRVIADHLRTISFAIADGQLPSNAKAGYVIRRILRRAVRYGYTFLGFNEPFMWRLLPVLIQTMGEQYSELVLQRGLIEKVIMEEETSFLRTLDTGIKLLDRLIDKSKHDGKKTIEGKDAFVLYDTYGFPFDLTELILRENDFSVNKDDFDRELEAQKDRSRQVGTMKTGDWMEVVSNAGEQQFVGYDKTDADVRIVKYRKINVKNKDLYQLVFDFSPFYAESGGQVGDSGYIVSANEKIAIIDTQKENNLSVHLCEQLPENVNTVFHAVVDAEKRMQIAANHSATHLLHFALQQVLGSHVEQKGSLVTPNGLRFDFSHFQKVSDSEIREVEAIANALIRANHALDERRNMPIDQARSMGAKALFGEKYGDAVRVIRFGDSIELCGGTHASATGAIGMIKVVSESAIAAGIRRIEAISGIACEQFLHEKTETLKEIGTMLKQAGDVRKSIEQLLEENSRLQKQLEAYAKDRAKILADELKLTVKTVNGVNFIGAVVSTDSAASLKDVAYMLKDTVSDLYLVLGAEVGGKANLAVMISANVVEQRKLNAGAIIKDIAREIQGGGGGQAFFATAGGTNISGLGAAIEKAKSLIV